MMTAENNQLECGIWDREGSCLIPLALLEKLPVFQRKTIPSDYQDLMGHMNIISRCNSPIPEIMV